MTNLDFIGVRRVRSIFVGTVPTLHRPILTATRRILGPLAVCVAVVIGYSNAATAQSVDTLACHTTLFDTLNVGPMILGEVRDTALWILNTTAADTIALTSGDTNHIRLGVSGIRMQSNPLVSIPFRLIGSAAGPTNSYIRLQPIDSCVSFSTKPIIAYVRPAAQDSSQLSLVHGRDEFVAVRSQRDTLQLVIRLHNNTTDAVTINNVTTVHAAEVHAHALEALPIALSPGDDLNVLVTFVKHGSGIVRDSLIVDPNEPIGSEGFAIIAYRTDSVASVRPRAAHGTWYVSPNPSDGVLHIHGPVSSQPTLELRDVLGNLISTLAPRDRGVTPLTFDLRPLALPAGAYFVRIEAMTEDGLTVKTIRVIVR